MKKLLLALTFTISLMAMTGCDSLTGGVKPFNFESKDQVYAFGAISTTNLLQQEASGLTPLEATTGATPSALGGESNLLVEGEVEDLNKYLNMMEKFLGTNKGFGTETVVSDLPEYETKIVFTAKDILGNDVVYALYLNETVVLTDTETEVDEDDEVDGENHEDLEDLETESTLTGLLIVGGVNYTIEGSKEVEEDEVKITVISQVDELNYVKVVYKTEEDEAKFSYEVVANGSVTNKTEVKLEVEDDETKTELKFLEGNAQGEYTFKMETEDGKQVIKVEYYINDGTTEESGEAKIDVIVDPITGETTYAYHISTDDDEESEVEVDRSEENEEDNDEEEGE
jgi:hypothetical protein